MEMYRVAAPDNVKPDAGVSARGNVHSPES